MLVMLSYIRNIRIIFIPIQGHYLVNDPGQSAFFEKSSKSSKNLRDGNVFVEMTNCFIFVLGY